MDVTHINPMLAIPMGLSSLFAITRDPPPTPHTHTPCACGCCGQVHEKMNKLQKKQDKGPAALEK